MTGLRLCRAGDCSVLWCRVLGVSLMTMILIWPGAGGCSRDPSNPGDRNPAGKVGRDRAPCGESRKSSGKVLLVHSYHMEYEWVAGITRGVSRALERSDVELEVFYMDTKRRTEHAWKVESGVLAKKTVADWQPDVVVAVDENAQKYVASSFAGNVRPQVVFCGVNGEPEDYGYPAKNVTGVLERPYLESSLELLKKIVPGVHRIAVITDNSPTSEGALKYMKTVKTGFEMVSWETPTIFASWKKAVLRAQETADAIVVYMYHTVKQEGRPNSLPPNAVMAWTVSHSKIPLVGLFSFSVDDGMLCGIVESAVEHGFEAGQIAGSILNGERAGSIPMRTAKKGQTMLNLDTARRLGIEVPGSVIKAADIVIGDLNGE